MKGRTMQKRRVGRPSKGPTVPFNMRMTVTLSKNIEAYISTHDAVKHKTHLMEEAFEYFMSSFDSEEKLERYMASKGRAIQKKLRLSNQAA